MSETGSSLPGATCVSGALPGAELDYQYEWGTCGDMAADRVSSVMNVGTTRDAVGIVRAAAVVGLLLAMGSTNGFAGAEGTSSALEERNALERSPARATADQSLALEAETGAKAPEEKESGFLLTNADELNIRFNGLTSLDGNYRVNPDQSVSIAGIGRLAVGSLKADQLETILSTRLSNQMRRQIGVSVEVSRFRPVFVTGKVVTSGATEWRPDLTLIQAVALAGGIASDRVAGSTGVAETNLLRRQALINLRMARVQLVRLEMERLGMPDAFLSEVSKKIRSAPASWSGEFKDFVTQQEVLLRERMSLMGDQVRSLEQQIAVATIELETSERRLTEVAERLKISKELSDSLERLRKERLVSRSRYLSQQTAMIEARVGYSEAEALVERARSRLAELRRQLAAVDRGRKIEINDQAERLRREIAQVELAAAEPGRETTSTEVANGNQSLVYYIARSSKDTTVQTQKAQLFTKVYPGDVIIVSQAASGPRSENQTADLSALTPGLLAQSMLENANRSRRLISR